MVVVVLWWWASSSRHRSQDVVVERVEVVVVGMMVVCFGVSKTWKRTFNKVTWWWFRTFNWLWRNFANARHPRTPPRRELLFNVILLIIPFSYATFQFPSTTTITTSTTSWRGVSLMNTFRYFSYYWFYVILTHPSHSCLVIRPYLTITSTSHPPRRDTPPMNTTSWVVVLYCSMLFY
jgi:hypothetical protein